MLMAGRKKRISFPAEGEKGKIPFHNNYFCAVSGSIHPVEFPAEPSPSGRNRSQKIPGAFSFDGEMGIAMKGVIPIFQRADHGRHMRREAPGSLLPRVDHDRPHNVTSARRGWRVLQVQQEQQKPDTAGRVLRLLPAADTGEQERQEPDIAGRRERVRGC